jgi:hypothetical protein
LKTPKINYIHGDKGLLNEIKQPWEALNEHHRQHSPNFKEYYCEMTFEKKKIRYIEEINAQQNEVDLALDTA